MVFRPLAWGGSRRLLASTGTARSSGKFQSTDPDQGVHRGRRFPGASIGYVGIIEGTQVDGAIVAGATGGAGVIFNVFGAQGSRAKGVSDDFNTVLGTVQFTGEPG